MKQQIKQVLASCLAAMLALQGVAPTKTFALEAAPVEGRSSVTDDGGFFRYMSSKKLYLARASVAVTSQDELIHNSRFDDYDRVYGVDVSKYQPDVDWSAVTADADADIEYAIVRLGYRGYGAEGNLAVDPYFQSNLEGAMEAGLDVGVYFFTQALNVEEAIAEANFVLEYLDGYDLQLPVYIDIEDITYATGRLDSAALTKEQHTANCKAFCDTIEAAGYEAGVYANMYWLTEKLVASELESAYDIWLANYTNQTEYQGEYQMWQFSSVGTVDGITGNVDLNVRYVQKAGFAEQELKWKSMEPFKPDYYATGGVTFLSSDPAVATVDAEGTVTPLKDGQTTITAITDDGSTDSMIVIIDAIPDIALDYRKMGLLEIAEQKKLTVSTENPDAVVTWRSTNPNVATITEDGIVESVNYGMTKIIVEIDEGKTAVCTVAVMKEMIQGDCNGDCVIDAKDAAEVLLFAANQSAGSKMKFDSTLLLNFDVNQDNTIDARDAYEILLLSARTATGTT